MSASVPSHGTWDILALVKSVDAQSSDAANESDEPTGTAPTYERVDFGQNLVPVEARKNLMLWLTANPDPTADLDDDDIDPELAEFPGRDRWVELRLTSGKIQMRRIGTKWSPSGSISSREGKVLPNHCRDSLSPN